MESFDRGNTHPRDEIGILAVRFLDATPAWIAGNVKDRGEDVLHAAPACLPCGDGEDLLVQRRIERRREGDRLGKTRSAGGDQPVKSLLVEEGRDSEARPFDEILLDGIGKFRGTADVVAVTRARYFSDSVGKQPSRFVDGQGVARAVVNPGMFPIDRFELRNLLRQRHPRDEIGCALRGGPA